MANTNIMVKTTTGWKTEFSKKVSNLIGYHLGEEHIHSDDNNFYYYIRQLEPGRPLLLMHYRGPLMAVIPDKDYQKLEAGEVDVDTYVDSSYFYFGYFWGGGNLTGAYWQPLEDTAGIHEKDKILRYLRILSCRTARQSSGYRPTAERCQHCCIDCTTCPLSSLNETGSWDKEVSEYDPRTTFFNQIQEKTGATFICSHEENNNKVRLRRVNKATLIADVPHHLLNEMMYHPEKDNVFDTLTFLKPVKV